MAAGPDNFPVIWVDWCDAYAFCKRSGKRLCGQISGTSIPTASFTDVTQDQWYQACTSNNPGTYVYPYGTTYSKTTCNGYGYNSLGMIAVGGAVNCHGPAAPYNGVFDMSGNADEWEDSCDQVSSGGPVNGDGRSDTCRTRGGSTYDGASMTTGDTPYFLTCGADWEGYTRQTQNHAVGFRCCAP